MRSETSRRVLLSLLAAASPGLGHPQAGLLDTPCAESRAAPGPSRNLYCLELDPVPALSGASASFELNRIPSPFGTNVTRDGDQVYAPVLRVAGLPEPAGFSPGARVWIAWIATPLLDRTAKLGVVGNGEYRLPNVAWSKFLVLVTAEPSGEATEPAGKVALRGFSPSNRLLPPDMTQFIIGTPAAQDSGRTSAARPADHEAHGPLPASGVAAWIHPPMPLGLAMMPAEVRLPAPAATPYLPGAGGAVIPEAKARELIHAADGDTVTLTAGLVRQTIRGHSFVGYGYNGQIPGPLIWANQGATLQVRYRNRIEWPNTVHWHGVRLLNRFDGADGVTQQAVPPGGDFDYSVHLRDAGLYWYHPHRRDDMLRDLGLYGNLMVRPRTSEYGPANREEVLMLDDMELADQGPVPYGAERPTHALMGRFGNVVLVNGRTDWSLRVERGEVVRFFLTNASNARTFNLSFGGAPMKLLGSDLSGFEREEWVESMVIAPAERYTVDVRFERSGPVVIENRVLALDHVFGRFFRQVDTLGTIAVGEQAARPDHRASFDSLRVHRGVVAELDRYRRQFGGAPQRTLVIRMEAQGLPFMVDRFLRFDSVYFHPVEWSGTMPMMNWNSTSSEVRWILEEPASGRQNMEIRWDFRVGELVRIRVANLRETLHAMQHPIHFHGQRFLVLGQNGVANTNLAWKDTFLLPAGGTADLLLEVSNPGTWMAHCHISEHLESGMMMTFTAK